MVQGDEIVGPHDQGGVTVGVGVNKTVEGGVRRFELIMVVQRHGGLQIVVQCLPKQHGR